MGENNGELRETHNIGRETWERIVDQQVCPALSLSGIQMTGVSHAAAPFQITRRRPSVGQLLLCVSGWGLVLTETGWTRSTPGSVYITPPDVLHAYRAVEGVRWELAWILYDTDAPDGPLAFVKRPMLISADVQPLADTILGLYRESMGLADTAMMHHWAALIRQYAQRIVGLEGSNRRLLALWESVDAHLSFPWTVTDLATRAGMSGEHLRRLCRDQIGRSPMRHVAHLRMRRAAALLISDSFTIESIADQVGYENAFAFSTAFKRHLGLSPSEYRISRRIR